jgi:hypothetical protein
MTLKVFTNAAPGLEGESIALNSSHVISVYESILVNQEVNQVNQVTNVFCVNGGVWHLQEDYLTVIARFNEQ